MGSPIHNMEDESVVTNEGLRNDVLEKFLHQFCHRHFAGVFSVDIVPPQLFNVHHGGEVFYRQSISLSSVGRAFYRYLHQGEKSLVF